MWRVLWVLGLVVYIGHGYLTLQHFSDRQSTRRWCKSNRTYPEALAQDVPPRF